MGHIGEMAFHKSIKFVDRLASGNVDGTCLSTI